jgi:di/tricarboxylate transporter
MNYFQMFCINCGIGIFLITVKYEMNEEQRETTLYFVGRKVNKYLILVISAAQLFFILFFMTVSNEPVIRKDSLLHFVRKHVK